MNSIKGDQNSPDAGKPDPGPDEASPARKTFARWLGVRIRWLRRALARGIGSLPDKIDHAAVLTEVEEDGKFGGRYVFMVVMASAIATLGLLLSSPAVIIGAMLISPLMGPIMLLGFSLCVLDFEEMKRSLIALAGGVAGALAIAILIVMFSPLREATPEILARTRPNLFDLLVAIFSGLAGGYSVINRKGATIVGVAIATALMPPLAVVGFGLATFNLVIAGGAFFLFMTNLLAIALSVTGLAWLHGFATVHARRFARWQTAAVLIVFVALSLPLGFALRDIAYETRVNNIVREQALIPFEGQESELSDLTVRFPAGGPIEIQQTVLVHDRVADAESQLMQRYEALLERPVEMRLNQILVADDETLDARGIRELAASSIAPLRQQVERLDQRQAAGDAIRNSIPFRAQAVDVDSSLRAVRIVPARETTLDLAALMEAEQEMSGRFPDWSIRIFPPVQTLPSVSFASGATLDEEARATIGVIIWAMKAWEAKACTVKGRVPLGGSASANRKLALERAEAVAALVKAAGLEVTAESGYGETGQAAEERRLGQLHFESATVMPKL
jgi:uncharacterized hydrophobic protein (TIGR00271 family)